MNPKIKPLTALLSWLAIAPLAMLSADTAWSESPGKTDAHKTVMKKSTAKKSTSKKSTARKAVAGKTKPAPGATAQPGLALKPATVLPVATGPLVSPPQASASLPAPTAAPAATAPAAPVAVNPYLPAQSANPWQAVSDKAPVVPRNPYLAYLYAAPATAKAPAASAPTPWSFPSQPAPQAGTPTWYNPFLAIRPPVLPTQPWNPPGSPFPVQAASPAPVASTTTAPVNTGWVNPYLNPNLPRPPVQATAPAFPTLVPSNWMPSFPALPAPAGQVASPPAPSATAPEATPWTPPAPQIGPSNNPYLAYLRAPPAPVAVASLAAAPAPVTLPPIIVQQPAPATSKAQAPQEGDNPGSSSWDNLKYSVMGRLPPMDQAILPKVTTVYPTGEKPLKVLTFKCPTELVGITPPTTAALHELVNFAFDGINKANLLPFNMQQVCQ